MSDYIERYEHNEFAKRMEEEHTRQNHRIKNLEDSVKTLNSLTIAVEKLAVGVNNMVEEQKKQGARLEKLENVPVDNWNKFKVGFLSALGGAVASGVIAVLIV